MPWHSLDRPCIALGILAALVQRERSDVEVEVIHGNLLFAEALAETAGAADSVSRYTQISEHGMFHGVGDWVFSDSLNGPSPRNGREYLNWLKQENSGVGNPADLVEAASTFVDRAAADIAGKFDLVGFTTTFMQNVPSLALARALKALQPDVKVVFGGGSCDGPQGAALHRNFVDAIDYVVRSEGERPLLALLDALELAGNARADALARIPGLCWEHRGRRVVNDLTPLLMQAHEIPRPDYAAYFDALAALRIGDHVDPSYVLEAARGCWWGEKSHCRFCGLNGTGMTYRSRPAGDVHSEIESAAAEYGVLDIVTVDNIMDASYPETLMPLLARGDLDLRLHFETKSDLSDQELDALVAGHVVHIQPGIESLSSAVLKSMGKGARGTQNVRLLRAAHERGLTVSWNFLFGFPGEDPAVYDDMLDQFPALTHLPAPGVATRISVQRFSPYFDDPSLGFAERSPASFYSWVYRLPPDELEDLVFLFDAPHRGIDAAYERRLHAAISTWQADAEQSWLLGRDFGEGILVEGERPGFPLDLVELAGNTAEVLRLVISPARMPGIMRRASDHGLDVDEWRVSQALRELRRLGLVYEDQGSWVSVVPFREPPVMRLAS